MRKILNIAAASLLLLVSLPMVRTRAQSQPSIKVQAPNVVAGDEQFNVTFIIEGENAPSDFEWTPGEDFQLVWGPQKGTSTSISVVNGKRSRTSQTTYTYVLMPRRSGRFTLPKAVATLKGETIQSGAASVEVVGGDASAPGKSSSSGSSGISPSGDISRDDLFLHLSLSSTSAVVGEPLTATLKLYRRVDIAGFEDAKFPAFNGFWSQTVFSPTNIEFQRESYRDRIYNTAVLRSWTIIPQQSGPLTIEPSELVCLVNIRASASTGSIFDSFFMDDYRTIRKRVLSEPVTVNVSALPSGAPASFRGAVGSFTMQASVSKDSIRTHDASSLVVKLSGKGNVSLLEAPSVSFPPDFELYDVKITETEGSKTFEFPFIARSHGDFVIDPVEYTFFDISNRRYVTLRSDPLAVRVSQSSGAPASPEGGTLVQGTPRKDVKTLGSDIRFIVTRRPSFERSGAFFYGSALFWGITAALVVLAAAAWLLLKRLSLKRADIAGRKRTAAAKMARRRLSTAGDYLSRDLSSAFYEELHKTLLGYISDKLSMDLADMSRDNMVRSLACHGVSDRTVALFAELLDACEYARYSPSSDHDAMHAHYSAAIDLIAAIDSSMKKTSTPSSASSAILPSLVLLLCLPLGASAAASSSDYPDSLWTAGTRAYTEGRWDEALSAWSSISELGVESCALYYNIGNACFKMGDYSHAILNYERASRLDPSDADVAHNLEFARGMVRDKIEVIPEVFFIAWARKACRLLSSDTWAVLFLVLMGLCLVCVVTFLLRVGVRRAVSFYAALFLLLSSLLCLGFAHSQKMDYVRDNAAIITRGVTSVRSSPGSESSTDLFILHEGTRVKVLDSVGEWLNIELSDGRQGWLPSSDLEMI